jgi:hypothetical protein
MDEVLEDERILLLGDGSNIAEERVSSSSSTSGWETALEGHEDF